MSSVNQTKKFKRSIFAISQYANILQNKTENTQNGNTLDKTQLISLGDKSNDTFHNYAIGKENSSITTEDKKISNSKKNQTEETRAQLQKNKLEQRNQLVEKMLEEHRNKKKLQQQQAHKKIIQQNTVENVINHKFYTESNQLQCNNTPLQHESQPYNLIGDTFKPRNAIGQQYKTNKTQTKYQERIKSPDVVDRICKKGYQRDHNLNSLKKQQELKLNTQNKFIPDISSNSQKIIKESTFFKNMPNVVERQIQLHKTKQERLKMLRDQSKEAEDQEIQQLQSGQKNMQYGSKSSVNGNDYLKKTIEKLLFQQYNTEKSLQQSFKLNQKPEIDLTRIYEESEDSGGKTQRSQHLQSHTKKKINFNLSEVIMNSDQLTSPKLQKRHSTKNQSKPKKPSNFFGANNKIKEETKQKVQVTQNDIQESSGKQQSNKFLESLLLSAKLRNQVIQQQNGILKSCEETINDELSPGRIFSQIKSKTDSEYQLQYFIEEQKQNLHNKEQAWSEMSCMQRNDLWIAAIRKKQKIIENWRINQENTHKENNLNKQTSLYSIKQLLSSSISPKNISENHNLFSSAKNQRHFSQAGYLSDRSNYYLNLQTEYTQHSKGNQTLKIQPKYSNLLVKSYSEIYQTKKIGKFIKDNKRKSLNKINNVPRNSCQIYPLKY